MPTVIVDDVQAIAQARGLKPETVRAAGLRRVTASEIAVEFGVEVPCGGIRIPYNGTSFARVRLDKPQKLPGHDKPAKYLTQPERLDE